MMEILPDPLICLTLQHVIDQRDAVEALMAEHTRAVEKCIPLALKEVFNLPVIPDAKTTSEYLNSLWADSRDEGYVIAAYYGLTRLLHEFTIPNSEYYVLSILNAFERGHADTARYLLTLPDANYVLRGRMGELFAASLHSGSPETVQVILDQDPPARMLERDMFCLIEHAETDSELETILKAIPAVLAKLKAELPQDQYLSMKARMKSYTPRREELFREKILHMII